ncbi:hypothetical protein [Priestia endophytica]|uniref:Uncharacterized protein n=1 Tax=Priestia endophytica DSM 13796 TaxID=1121089 RepID=A0A1I6C7D2_9BACI|nr:hypothetical protein [Priestia endophytica]KYG33487.1 hypothetical protein AZF06_21835 [Priestia endophytica]SFQ89088.1 hypothetical protein SAMN02745910_05197 [Priestia endophytica DSM 13796]
MKSALRDFSISALASIFIAALPPSFFQFIHLGKAFGFKELSNIIVNNTFLVSWILLLVIILVIRKLIRNKIDKMQAPVPMFFAFTSHYDANDDIDFYGFKWKVFMNANRTSSYTNDISGVSVDRVDGPYCKNDYREMKESRTYFGRYKYKCPKCGYKNTLFKNSWTLESDIKDEIEAQYRKQTRVK